MSLDVKRYTLRQRWLISDIVDVFPLLFRGDLCLQDLRSGCSV